MKLIPKNWSDFQQYKDRKPLWIKLHRDLLNDFSYSSVHIGTKATLPLLWLLACEYEDGIIDATLEEIAFRIHIDKKTIDKAIKELVECNFFALKDECTLLYETVPREEKRRDREETEKKTDEFSFTLTTQKLLSSTSREYQSKLKEYILNSGKQMSYEDFYNQCEMKPYKYKNFKMAYDSWNKKSNAVTTTQPKSFKQQDKETSRNKVNAYLESGYSLRGNSEHLEVEVITHDN